MNESPEQRALAASTVALLLALAAVAMFLPPLRDTLIDSPLRATVVGLTLACALLLHWVFLAIGARRMARSVAGWVSLSVLLCPVGSVAALVLLNWFSDEAHPPSPQRG
jgi:protein-S-isoprenylcysteine O-methyltransferase Ste14